MQSVGAMADMVALECDRADSQSQQRLPGCIDNLTGSYFYLWRRSKQ